MLIRSYQLWTEDWNRIFILLLSNLILKSTYTSLFKLDNVLILAMSITERAQSMISQLPNSEVQKIGDHFVDILQEQNCVVIDRHNTRVDWEMNPSHKDLLKILKKTRGRNVTIESIDELHSDEQILYEKRKHILSDRFKNKAQRRYFMSVVRGKKLC